MAVPIPPQTLFGKLKRYVEKYERRTSLFASVFGFLTDVFTLTRIDHLFTEILLFSYLAVASAGIFFVSLLDEKKLPESYARFRPVVVVLIQFAFGGLFGRYFLHYFGSASLFTSWPFILILAGLLIGNEFARKYYGRFVFNLSIFYLTVLFFLTFYIPVVLGQMGDTIFLVSGALSIGVILLYLKVFFRYLPELINAHRGILITLIFGIYATTNVLYFTRIIPPLPLGLHDVGVYYSVDRTEKGYEVQSALQSYNLLQKWLHLRTTMYITEGMPVYVYSAVFAPINFGTTVVHQWERYDTTENVWIPGGKISFPIIGGEDRGYRGYSFKNNVTPGLWRVNIETENGLVIGRTTFRVEYTTKQPILIKDIL